MNLANKDILGTGPLSREEIEGILDTAVSFKEISTRQIKKVPTLRGRTIVNLFFEASTRTRASFEIAGKRLSADVVNFSPSSSSLKKSESILDTAKTLDAMDPDAVVVRHAVAGVPKRIADVLEAPVINAGDGAHEHPTQALLDMLTVRQEKGRIDGLTVTIVGDILHSRVARSNIYGFRKMGADVRIAAPPPMIPPGVETLGVKAYTSLPEALDGADVVMALHGGENTTVLVNLRTRLRMGKDGCCKLRMFAPDTVMSAPRQRNLLLDDLQGGFDRSPLGAGDFRPQGIIAGGKNDRHCLG